MRQRLPPLRRPTDAGSGPVTTLLQAIGLVLVVEGLAYALAPSFLRRLAEELPKLDDQTLRLFGVAALAAGTGLVFLARHWG